MAGTTKRPSQVSEGRAMIKIWGRNTSVNVQKVMWAVGELKLPHERIDVGGAFGKNNEPAYLAMKDRKSTRLNSSHANISYAVFCLKKKQGAIEVTSSTRSL